MLEVRAFESDFLRRLDRLALAVKRARSQRLGVRSVGRAQGSSIEPESFREYAEGDDLRFLDWNALGRLDHLFVRTFRAERESELTVMVDASASMDVPAADDKRGLGLALGAALVYIAMSSYDPARLVAFKVLHGAVTLVHTEFHRRREAYLSLRPFVMELKCGGETRLCAAIEELLAERRQPGVVVVISDFLVNRSDYEDALTRLLTAGHEVKAVHVMGERESTGALPPGFYRLRDAETGEIRDFTMNAQAVAAYRRRVEQLCEGLREFCNEHRITYSQAFGAQNLDAIVEREFQRLGVFE